MARRKILAAKNVGEVITELGVLYRDCRGGRVDTLDGSRLASILSALRMTIEAGDIEARVLELEKRIADRV